MTALESLSAVRSVSIATAQRSPDYQQGTAAFMTTTGQEKTGVVVNIQSPRLGIAFKTVFLLAREPSSSLAIAVLARQFRRSGRTALYWVHTPTNRSDVIDPETKNRGATPS